jgi:hypothetical protein
VFDPRAGKNALSTCSDTFAAAYNHLESDTLYFVDGISVKKFGQGDGAYSYLWKSKPFTSLYPKNFAWSRVDAQIYPVTFKLYADSVLKLTHSVLDSEPFRLPSGYLAKEWEFEISGTAAVNSVAVADLVSELV